MSKKWRGLAAALLFGAVAAGCAQEGKLIDTPLSVRGVAYDQAVDSINVLTQRVYFTTRFKIQAHGMNACEITRALLELSRVGPGGLIFAIRPLARYNTDDACMNAGNAAGDTTLTLTIRSILVPYNDVVPYLIDNVEGPIFPVFVDTTRHAAAGTIQFRVKVEDRAAATAITGATVALDSLSISGGAVGPIGTAITDALGLATFDVPSTVPEGANAFRYQVTVTSGANTQVLKVRDAPALGQTIERVYVRI